MTRIDYIKVRFAIPMGEDFDGPFRARFAQHLVWAQEAARLNQGGTKLHTDYATDKTFIFKYVELWGEAANEYATSVIGIIGADEVMRIDIRQELPGEVNLRELGEQAETIGRRQYQWFNTRIRSKSDDRTSGGFGWAKGSHKSEKRISVYKRGEELPAAELQLRGGKASDYWKECTTLYNAQIERYRETDKMDTENALDYIGQKWLESDLQHETGIELAAILSTAESEPYDEMETRLATLDALWSEIDAETKSDWLQMQIFGPDELKGAKKK